MLAAWPLHLLDLLCLTPLVSRPCFYYNCLFMYDPDHVSSSSPQTMYNPGSSFQTVPLPAHAILLIVRSSPICIYHHLCRPSLLIICRPSSWHTCYPKEHSGVFEPEQQGHSSPHYGLHQGMWHINEELHESWLDLKHQVVQLQVRHFSVITHQSLC